MKKIMMITAAVFALAIAPQSFAGGGDTGMATCASHGGECGKGGKTRPMRYGYAGNWAQADLVGGTACLPENFANGTITGQPFADENNGGIANADKICEE